MNEIERKFETDGYVVGGELILPRSKAEALLEEYRKRGYVILGMDFYRKTAKGDIEELIGRAADFSSLANDPNAAERSFSEAKAVLEKNASDVELYSVVVQAPSRH